MYFNIPDNSSIGGFNFTWDFDADEYQDWLLDEEMENSPEAYNEYITNNVTFTLEYVDHETFHQTGEYAELTYEGIVEEYGEKVASNMRSWLENNNGKEGFIDKLDLFDDEIDLSNPNEVDKAALEILPHGEYHKNARGFILSNGEVVFTEGEHNECSMIPGVQGTMHFIKLGNIRVLQQSIDLGKEPTRQQERTLAQVIDAYSESILYVDFITDKEEYGLQYTYPDYRRVINDIKRYFREGIKPQSRVFGENKEKNKIDKMRKTIKLTENELKSMIGRIVNEEISLTEADWMPQIRRKWQMSQDFKNNEVSPDYGKRYDGSFLFPGTNKNVHDWSDSCAPEAHQRKSEMDKAWDEHEQNESKLHRIIREEMDKILSEKSEIEIKPENKGKFNATKKRTGKSTEELTHSKNPLTRKRAVFAQNAKRWNHKK